MRWGDIPEVVRTRLASERSRMYHALWHFVRNRQEWTNLEDQERDDLIRQGWEAPRFEDESGAGIDFLYMHRRMIEMVNLWASEVDHPHPGDASATRGFVHPWINIPWDHNDPVWPMPPIDLASDPQLASMFGSSKEQAATDFFQRLVSQEYENRDWLRNQTLDQFGINLEFRIHGWMHMHWSTEPPANPNSLDVTNDWLGSAFSSAVNPHFWKLHGWIDDRIGAWEDANGQEADLSNGWDGPPDFVTGEMHSADPSNFAMLRFAERPPLLMPWQGILLETTEQASL